MSISDIWHELQFFCMDIANIKVIQLWLPGCWTIWREAR